MLTLGPAQDTLTAPLRSAENWSLGEGRIILGGRANDVRTSKGRGRGTLGLNSLLTPDHLQLRGICLRLPTEQKHNKLGFNRLGHGLLFM